MALLLATNQAHMTNRFNDYIGNHAADCLKDLCLREGHVRSYKKGDEFFSCGSVARWFGHIISGTLKYSAFGPDGTEHVVGLVFTGELVGDFPFSFNRHKARVSVIAETDCEICCLSTSLIGERLKTDSALRDIVMGGTEAVFSTVYDRYLDLHCKTAGERYADLISKHPDLFALFPLKDIASFLNITPTHLSRLRKGT